MVLYNALPKKEYERIFMCKTAKDIWKSLLITHQGNSQVNDNKIDLLIQQYEQFTILEEESIDSGFARFNTIITSLKALDEGFSSKNYVRKFFRALHPKWRAKVTTIEESKDLSSLTLDELIGNLKVHKVVIEKDSEIYRGKKERVKSIALKAKEKSSDDETSTSGSDDEEYAIAVKNFKKFFRRKGKFVRCDDPNHLIDDCRKPPRNKDQKAFIGGSWSDSENDAEDKTNDETCLMAQSSNECMRTRNFYFPNNSSVTISRRRNKRRTPNVVKPELRIIVQITPMADDYTMGELLQAPTEGYGEAILISKINADHFEIKTNLLQLVQGNPYHGFEREKSHTHINNFKRITSTLKFRDVPNDVIKLMMFSYSLKRSVRVWENASKSDDRIDKLADQISTLVDIFAKKVVTPSPVKAVEESYSKSNISQARPKLEIPQTHGGLRTSNALHNAIIEAGGKDRPPMLAPVNYTDKVVPVAEGNTETTTERYMENYKNVSQDIRDQLNAEAEAVQIILTGIDNDIYSAVDACPNACEMWKTIKRLKQGESINVQDLETNLYWEFGKFS
nr:zf-CCHC domain-containing protein/UBN2 domain-containing protein [Tanacetum cinerariifolium]